MDPLYSSFLSFTLFFYKTLMKPVSFFFLRQWIPKQSKTGVLHIKKKFLGFLILPLQAIRNNGVSELTILAEIVEEKPQRNRKLRRINHVSSSHYDDQAFLIHQLEGGFGRESILLTLDAGSVFTMSDPISDGSYMSSLTNPKASQTHFSQTLNSSLRFFMFFTDYS
ncbi:hypothetical protein HanXRQr2_Chr17g0791191 [Helianthus annuus]|uniref:Uncharacterized protein n=1 Tax=Helianthus annuus TaxID=4232 RepID=A0A9K3GTN8_HELAN|nr:hypothetical protein HanXRQr2_Chr17g0791191 [Helianthus annuus]KAJ0428341.1 hypothetical protein HanHA300_Chr17g0645001 [Helianthus annuus]KAJ0631577.1 hypothetical protein HanLR1_Chr17g0655471 [Helianthus annuus]KAJ0812185.1 hypothetical protein HanPSC8_Chr17g0759091 [Helianthus annuus]